MRMPKPLLVLLIPALIYGAGYGYLWYEVKSTADDAVRQAAPLAEIRYRSVHVSPLGDEVGFDDITVKPTMVADEFRIEKLRFSAPHAGYFIAAGKSIERGEIPKKLGIQISSLQLDINGELFSMLEQMQQMQRQAGDAESGSLDLLSSVDALGCGKISSFTLKDYRRMGMGALNVDVGTHFTYDDALNSARVTANAKAEGLYSMDFSAEFRVGTSITALAASGIPKSSINYRDIGYHKLRNSYCARMSGGDGAAYVERNFQLLTEALDVELPEKAAAAYKQFMLNGGSVDVKIDPDPGLDPMSLQHYTLDGVVDVLGMQMSINGTRMAFSEIQWNSSKTRSSEKAPIQQESVMQPAPVAPLRPTVRPIAQSTPKRSSPATGIIPVSDAGKHLNSKVEITTEDGAVRSGILEQVTGDRLRLRMRLSAGTMTYPIEVRKVTTLRVIE